MISEINPDQSINKQLDKLITQVERKIQPKKKIDLSLFGAPKVPASAPLASAAKEEELNQVTVQDRVGKAVAI